MTLKRYVVNKNILGQFFTLTLSLLTSFSTLICCALPVLLVTVGMGATVVSLVSIFPWIIYISKYKTLLFTVAGLLLIISGYAVWKGKDAPCPTDPADAKKCSRLRSINLNILLFSSMFYIIGFFFAFLADNIFNT